MKKIVCIFGMLFFLVTKGYGEETRIFTGSNSYFNYSISYPSDWQAINIYGFARIISPLEGTSDDFKENIWVTVADLSKKLRSLEEFNTMMLNKIIPLELSNFSLLSQGKTAIDGRETLFCIYKGTKDGKNLKYKRYSFKNNSSVYELTFESKEVDFDKYLPKAENIIASVKVAQK